MTKKLTTTTRGTQIEDSKLFEIAVNAVGLKGIQERNHNTIKQEIIVAYNLLKEVADEL